MCLVRNRFILGVLLLLAGSWPASASVIISEIMFNPAGEDNDSTSSNYTFTREWVELYNTSSAPIDISGWRFGDAADNNWASPFPQGTVLGGKQTLIVTGDMASFEAVWGTGAPRIQVSAFPNLANTYGTNEAAAIRDHLGVIRDVVRFQDDGWPTANGSNGNSVFLLPTALDATANDDPANWRPASQGVYGSRFVNGGTTYGINHGSPGFVATVPQPPFAPSPDAVWSMVVLPDTQNYVKNTRDYHVLIDQINWIKENRDLHNIQLVLQEGDIVNQNNQVAPTSGNQSSQQQWENARAAFSLLNGHVPYIMAVGNHDIGTTNAQSRQTFFNDYFKAADNPLVDSAIGGILKGVKDPGRLENAYYELDAPDGRKMLIFSLEYWPRQSVIAWANQIASLPKYRDYTAVLMTHSYMNSNEDYWRTGETVSGLGTDGNDGEDMWHELVKLHGNFEMTLNGHIGGDGIGYKRSIGVEGNAVHQMLFNSQFETNGGNGWLRLIEFLNDGKRARVRTYSPYLDLYRTGPAHEFIIDLSPLPMTPGDFNADGVVDASDLEIWAANYGMTEGATRILGDANGDGAVDGKDFLAWQAALTGAASRVSGAAIPEPAAAVLALCAAAVCVQRRGIRRSILDSTL